MNPMKFCQDQIQNGWLIAIFLAQIDKIFENFVCPDEHLKPHRIFVCDNLHMHLLQSSYEQSFYPLGDTIALAIYLLIIDIKRDHI